ncbi:calcium-binding protein [Phyllobacterium bourgognense]|uniref:Hemolysin type calcium-binding protein n=1 Tax=Phyllobacterium bourgognense TaxID=314236 RepID=A0A368YVQ6_9HYPH|nr:calcium-binding protein [Phyllobacterium bourgognense]RCW83047.1 hemolysin type calcium-binding protein [Phyllobacterium bourgognense]
MAINLPNGLLKLLGIDPSTIVIPLGPGGDTFNGTNANEHILGNGGGDTINAGGGSDIVEGGMGGDTLNGQDGNDYIEGGIGGDTMNGGAGSDTLGYSQSGSSVKVTLNDSGGGTTSGSGSGPGNHAQGDTIAGFENVVGSGFADTITGNNLVNVLAGLAGNDKLYGMGGNDVLIGGAGADVLDGGSGTDTADYSTSAAPVHLLLGGGVSSGGDAAGDTFKSIEKFVGTAGADVFDGSASLTGFSVDGGGGADTMIGGHGNDHLSIGGAAAAVAGFSALATAGGTIEGGRGDDSEHGSGGDDDMSGGDGNDGMHGGEGNDGMRGDAGNDGMRGDGGHDTMDGGDGDDVIEGGAGNDDIRCGPGDDKSFGGDDDDNLRGSAGLNEYDGGSGNDNFVASDTEGFGASGSLINGGEGALFNVAEVEEFDHMDMYERSDKVDIELTDQTASLAGTTASTSQMRYAYDGEERLYNVSGIERYSLTAFDDSMIDNSEDHILFGGDGNDFLDGRGGDDQLFGGFGNDTLVGGDGNDNLVAGFGAGGNETLYGGFGADRFAFASVEELSSAFTFIQDFLLGEGDRIDLFLIDANTTNTEVNDAFEWVNFLNGAGQLSYTPGGDDFDYNIIEGDVDGGGADFAFYVNKFAGEPTEQFFFL